MPPATAPSSDDALSVLRLQPWFDERYLLDYKVGQLSLPAPIRTALTTAQNAVAKTKMRERLGKTV